MCNVMCRLHETNSFHPELECSLNGAEARFAWPPKNEPLFGSSWRFVSLRGMAEVRAVVKTRFVQELSMQIEPPHSNAMIPSSMPRTFEERFGKQRYSASRETSRILRTKFKFKHED